MSISAEDFKSILQQQQAKFERSQLRLIQPLTQVINLQTSVSSQSGSSLSFADSIAATITEFHYEPASGLTFDSGYWSISTGFQNRLRSCKIPETNAKEVVVVFCRTTTPLCYFIEHALWSPRSQAASHEQMTAASMEPSWFLCGYARHPLYKCPAKDATYEENIFKKYEDLPLF
ncbi:hypothetical protein T265_01299 [Opisthorchis viverrini]|uniref:Uncharacterized protein n=1 Tax=Opisthorchis viverrini TaxID=6198 RepID=A0A074ZZV7_OPIVI|nr:hypothetical protein T265_01299 [Opisthorchis viverrini]KER32611.1 hypothetical protein T265_01299 [Opisthorchis viverrini]